MTVGKARSLEHDPKVKTGFPKKIMLQRNIWTMIGINLIGLWSSRASNIENVQHGTIRRSGSGTLGHCLCQQPLQFAKIADF